MTDSFLHLAKHEQAEILQALSPKLGMPPNVLEKDIWVCWALHHLFRIFDHKMVFKGGTSLSKVFNVIRRFSEDWDITFDYRDFKLGVDPLQFGLSKNQIKKASEKLKDAVRDRVYSVIKPHFHVECHRGELRSSHERYSRHWYDLALLADHEEIGPHESQREIF